MDGLCGSSDAGVNAIRFTLLSNKHSIQGPEMWCLDYLRAAEGTDNVYEVPANLLSWPVCNWRPTLAKKLVRTLLEATNSWQASDVPDEGSWDTRFGDPRHFTSFSPARPDLLLRLTHKNGISVGGATRYTVGGADTSLIFGAEKAPWDFNTAGTIIHFSKRVLGDKSFVIYLRAKLDDDGLYGLEAVVNGAVYIWPAGTNRSTGPANKPALYTLKKLFAMGKQFIAVFTKIIVRDIEINGLPRPPYTYFVEGIKVPGQQEKAQPFSLTCPNPSYVRPSGRKGDQQKGKGRKSGQIRSKGKGKGKGPSKKKSSTEKKKVKGKGKGKQPERKTRSGR